MPFGLFTGVSAFTLVNDNPAKVSYIQPHYEEYTLVCSIKIYTRISSLNCDINYAFTFQTYNIFNASNVYLTK